MKNIRVKLVPLAADDREQFILDNQWSFKHSALLEFGERDNHIDADGEIISRKTVEMCMDAENSETYRIVLDGKNVGGMILQINKETNENELGYSVCVAGSAQQGYRLRSVACRRSFASRNKNLENLYAVF